MMHFKAVVAALLAGAVVAASSGALASMTYPEALRSELGLEEIAGTPPGCQLCHRDDVGGLKTATKPFARSLLTAGASGANVPGLLSALHRLEKEATDSDSDGVGDIDELRAGSDPNVPSADSGVVLEDIPLPETGCSLGRGDRPAAASVGVLILAALALLRRSRR
jgi:hypothetical protein